MNKLELYNRIIERLKNPKNESIKMSLNNVHAKGLFSLVVDGDEPGKLTRVFISDKKLKPFDVQFHTHRYPIRLTTIKGKIKHHVADIVSSGIETVNISMFEYKSFLSGGFGLKYESEVDILCADFIIPNGSTISMGVDEFHTVSCSKGSIWIVEELGFKTDTSKVLGIPFTIDSLYNEPAMFQINDKCQTVLNELNQIVKYYNSLSNEPK